MTHDDMNRLLNLATIPEVAAMLNVHPRTIKRMIDRGDLPAVWITPRLCRIDLAEVLAFIERRHDPILAALKRVRRGYAPRR